MIFALLTLLTALGLAAVAGWFSIIGVMAIFAAFPMHALIMGIALECGKLVTTSWLYRNWTTAGLSLKAPLIAFTITLMLATSMGVFGFLSKAHLEQGAATVDNSAKVERLDQQIAREKATIEDDSKVIAQLDATINSYLGKDRADRSVAIRKSQAPQRAQLRADIDAAQKRIDAFSDEKMKLQSEVRKLQLEVGPIRYIAELLYGTDNSEKNIESAVRIFTLLIVSTFDPLAVILLIAANHSLMHLRRKKDEEEQVPGIKETANEWKVAESVGEVRNTNHTPEQAGNIATAQEVQEVSSEVLSVNDETENVASGERWPVAGKVYQAATLVAEEGSQPESEREDTVSEDNGGQVWPEIHYPVQQINEEAPELAETALVPLVLEQDKEAVDVQDMEAPFYYAGREAGSSATEAEAVRNSLSEMSQWIKNAQKTTILAKETPGDTAQTQAVIIQSAISRVQNLPVEEVADTSGRPWAQDHNTLRELVGSGPHFIPVKVNEETKPKEMEESALGQQPLDALLAAGPAPQVVQMVESRQEEDTQNPQNASTAARSFPEIHSWLAEFKRT
jgi:hypothetical protein